MGKEGTVHTEKGYQCKLVRHNDSTEDLYLTMITLEKLPNTFDNIP